MDGLGPALRVETNQTPPLSLEAVSLTLFPENNPNTVIKESGLPWEPLVENGDVIKLCGILGPHLREVIPLEKQHFEITVEKNLRVITEKQPVLLRRFEDKIPPRPCGLGRKTLADNGFNLGLGKQQMTPRGKADRVIIKPAPLIVRRSEMVPVGGRPQGPKVSKQPSAWNQNSVHLLQKLRKV